MADLEGTISINRSADEAFRALSSVENVPRIVPWIKRIRAGEGGRVMAVGEENGRERELHGFFRPAPEERRVDWKSEGAPYQGWLQVRDAAPGCELTVHVQLAHLTPEHTQATLANVLNAIRRLIEGDQVQTA